MSKKKVVLKTSKKISSLLSEVEKAKSVRTTYRMDENRATQLTQLSARLGLDYKAIFDIFTRENPEALGVLKGLLESKTWTSKVVGGTRKSFVISKGAVQYIAKLAVDHKASRDSVLSFLIYFYFNQYRSDSTDRLQNLKGAVEAIQNFIPDVYALEDELSNLLDGDELASECQFSSYFDMAMSSIQDEIDRMEEEEEEEERLRIEEEERLRVEEEEEERMREEEEQEEDE